MRAKYYLQNPRMILVGIIIKLNRWIDDEKYIKILYRLLMRRRLDLKSPKSFNEKIQWLKLYDRKSEYIRFVDKYQVKNHVHSVLGEEYIIPTLGVWDKPEDIDWDLLPSSFVLKTTHGGGGKGVIICKDKKSVNKLQIVNTLKQAMNIDIYSYYREWPYKFVKKKIIAETFLVDSLNEASGIPDYKFFCFDGVVKFFKVDFNRFENHQANYYTPTGQLMPFGESVCPPDFHKEIKLPNNLNKMLDAASRLSEGIPFIRIDLYDVNGHIYFGEATFYPGSGFVPFIPDEWDYKIGDFLTLPNNSKLV